MVPLERQSAPLTTTSSVRALWASGLFTFAIAYTYSIVVGSIFLASCCSYNSYMMYIPLAGGFLWPTADSSSSSSVSAWMGIPGSAVQVLGAILFIIGASVRVTRVVQSAGDGLPRLASGPGEVGLGLAWDL